jgi:hypothetical protein
LLMNIKSGNANTGENMTKSVNMKGCLSVTIINLDKKY